MKPLAELTLDELLLEFSQMEDWEERCDSLIDLGFELPEMPAEEKTEANRVHGCQSHVWLTARTESEPGQPPQLRFHAASDAMIVSGLIAVLMLMYNGQSAQKILEIDPRVTFAKLELDRHLSSQRRNGLSGMVQRIRQVAAEALVAADR